jgi:hypothetical protein
MERTTCSTVFSPPRMEVAVPWTELKNRTVRVILVDMVKGKFWQGNASETTEPKDTFCNSKNDQHKKYEIPAVLDGRKITKIVAFIMVGETPSIRRNQISG